MDRVLVITPETTLSDVIKVIDMESNNQTFIIKPLPSFYEPYIDLKDLGKPFYDGVYKKGGKKNKKRFGR